MSHSLQSGKTNNKESGAHHLQSMLQKYLKRQRNNSINLVINLVVMNVNRSGLPNPFLAYLKWVL